MSPTDPDGLLERVRHARAEALRARRLAKQMSDDHARITLWRYADEMEAKVVALEQEASSPVVQTHQQMQQAPEALEQKTSNIIPPVVERHTTPQQMQQAQVTPPAGADDDGD